MEQLIAEVREKGRQREALAQALLGGIADGDSLSFYRKDGQTALVGPDVSKARGFRLTRFDRMGPIGHAEANSMREAVRRALSDGFLPSDAENVATVEAGSIVGECVLRVGDLRERMSAVVREVHAYGSSRVKASLRLAGRTGPLTLLEADCEDWSAQTPTYMAGDLLPVSEGVGNHNGSAFAFWIGDREPGWPEVERAMTSFIADHDVVRVRFIRALPDEVHAAIAKQWEAANAMSAEDQQRRQLFKDDRGHLVEVKTMGLETVEFANQGGGFLRKMSRAEFEKRYAPTDTPSYEAVTIVAEWLNDDARLPAYSNGLLWNGWAMPYFEKDTAMRLMEMMPGIRYDEERDVFIARDEGIDEDDVYGKVSIRVDDKTVDTYAIGAGSWCWETSEGQLDVAPPVRMRI
jgi:hypothetical protein